ncbi:hypothetical protein Tco_0908175 [Tanacetum coccineum]|uniref:Aspartic peptidase DDI1-type domain-containing protein n=1 Tax=Tanacetum coccineum TaxID=301880 RepID=A0ABQ5CLE1_9ASTR
MKYLVENKPRAEEDNEIRMNLRCPALLHNHLPPKEQDPGSFILSCSIGKLDFKNALADLGASISIMPFSMYKCLGIGKLKPINMLLEMAHNTKCAPTGIVKNLLIKIDKFIFPVDFVILDKVFCYEEIGIRGLIDSYSCGSKVLSWRNHLGETRLFYRHFARSQLLQLSLGEESNTQGSLLL